MTYQEIDGLVKSFGFPCVYHHWKPGTAPELPYVVYYYDNRSDFMADDENYVNIASVTIELYSGEKDFEAEQRIEKILKENKLPFDKMEIYIESEELFEQVYTIEVVINEEDSDGEKT